ncbi:MAG: hypothetical protein ACM3UR_11730 [Bacteroidota bacterium]|nr:DUF4270 domain-containing protein [Ignavibacteria bacterium]MCU7497733.1 DUF4270 domain-containing protein [Ignavibacteria bacterium]MCU7510962.1 DUF4270 domain-containing protein [Ignavibacteria bacterium]MCU7518815.1 DUF4270 domain-containing protein [Ignavibacteria bacterium]MCU7523215.1 DUF4270 domain-containing protein [Ignavibacteria bacterium]
MYSKFKYIYLMVLVGTTMLLSSCADDPSTVGLGLLDPNDYITLNADSSIQTQSASYFKTEAKLSASDRLLLGKYGNIQASMLVQFALTSLPDTTRSGLLDGTVTIKSATVEMSKVYTLGSSTAPFDFSVHKINNSWGQNFTADSLSKLNYDAFNLKSSELNTSDTLYTFSLDKNSVTSWLKDTSYTNSHNYGLYFAPSASSGKIVGFQAIALSLTRPLLTMSVVFSKHGQSDYTVTFNDNNDLHTIAGSLPQITSTDLVVQGGIAVSSKFQITTANIPQDAIINSAILELTVDTLHSVLGSPASNYLVVQFVTNSSTNAYDTTSTTVLNKSGNVFSGNIASHLQRWLKGEANNGLMISLGNETATGDLYAFKSGNAADRPRLKILYTAKSK